MNPRKMFTKEQQQRIVEAIQQAELETSGEIRVHIEDKCKGDALERAKKIFKRLKMYQTAERNGTIIYLAVEDRKLAIWGDKGINEKVPENFWEDVKEAMVEHFRKGEFTEGLVKGIAMVGEKLKTFFPHRSDDVNELSDEISFGEEEK